MPAEDVIAAVAGWGLTSLGPGVAEKFSAYYDLLSRWNARLNLTAIRTPEGVLRRHFLECIFCAQNLPNTVSTLLDYGSGAGFPGIPIALCRPEICVTLCESQRKKASFLQEAVRVLDISAEIYAARAEEMPVERSFDAVTLRAVDRMQGAVTSAANRVAGDGFLVLLAGSGSIVIPGEFLPVHTALPGSSQAVLIIASRMGVPRGTVSSVE